MKSILQKTVLILALCVIGFHGFATHVAGGEITWKALGNRYYEVQLRLYFDCSGLRTIYPSVPIQIYNGCNNQVQTIYTIIDSSSVQELGFICDQQAQNSACLNGNGNVQSFETYYYTARIQLPETCDDFTFYYELCCRNNLVNVRRSTDDYFTITSRMFDASENQSSPELLVNEIPHFCVNRDGVWSPGVKFENTDSLRFELANARDQNGNVSYNNGYSSNVPLRTTVLEPKSGLYRVEPDREGVFVLSHNIVAYRNGKVIAEIGQNIDAHVVSCNGILNASGRGAIENESGVSVSQSTLTACPENEFCFTVNAGKQNLSNGLITYKHNWNELFAEGAVTQNVVGENLMLTFCGKFYLQDFAAKNLVIQLEDNSCPYNVQLNLVYNIVPEAAVRLPEDTVICKGEAYPLPYLANKNLTFSVVNRSVDTSEISCVQCTQPVITPQSNMVLVATGSSSGCKVADTMLIAVEEFPEVELLTTDSQVCMGGLVQVTPSPWQSTYAIVYTDSIGNNVTNKFNSYYYWTEPGYKQINAIVYSENGCKRYIVSDSIEVLDLAAPRLDWLLDNQPCNTDTVVGLVSILGVGYPCVPDSLPDFSGKEPETTYGTNEPIFQNPEDPKDGPTLFTFDGNVINNQYLYTWQSLARTGLLEGYIQSIAFFIDDLGIWNGSSTTTIPNATISVTCTNQNTLDERIDEGRTVFQGPIQLREGKVKIRLDNMIFWNGLDNLVFSFCFQEPNFRAPDAPIMKHTLKYQTIGLINQQANSCNDSQVRFRTNYLPLIEFEYYPAGRDDDEYTLVWTEGEDTTITSERSYPFFFSGDKEVGVMIIDSANGCSNKLSTTMKFLTTDTLKALEDTVIVGTDTVVVFKNRLSTGRWFINGEEVKADSDAVNISFVPEQIGLYTISYITNESCSQVFSTSIWVMESPFREVAVPNVITPNNDGVNDDLRLINADLILSYKGHIYNRFGVEIATISSEDTPWNGGENSEGVYFYVIEAVNFAGEPEVYKGFITLLK